MSTFLWKITAFAKTSLITLIAASPPSRQGKGWIRNLGVSLEMLPVFPLND